MIASERGQAPDPAERTGWAEVKEILADFLLVFFGAWLFGRATLDWLNGLAIIGQLSTLMLAWMVIETGMSLCIIALGIDMWRSHSRERAEQLAGHPRRRERPQME